MAAPGCSQPLRAAPGCSLLLLPLLLLLSPLLLLLLLLLLLRVSRHGSWISPRIHCIRANALEAYALGATVSRRGFWSGLHYIRLSMDPYNTCLWTGGHTDGGPFRSGVWNPRALDQKRGSSDPKSVARASVESLFFFQRSSAAPSTVIWLTIDGWANVNKSSLLHERIGKSAAPVWMSSTAELGYGK